MVRAILDGRKTQTRRAIKPQPQPDGGRGLHPVRPYRCPDGRWNWVLAATGHGTRDPFHCPYGTAGDLLWVRETWRRIGDLADSECTSPADAMFRATATEAEYATLRWKPAIHMPRWASRLTLRITNIRVERLQDITLYDAQQEGIDVGPLSNTGAKRAYADLWESINGKRSWDTNPWVWVLEFEQARHDSGHNNNTRHCP